ncbi:MAG: FAD-binding oxidoreductase [Candidatus Dormibacteraeota bacterium]|nr:FAD-binding oxidoreductase [Candidatus Dormibacteraeota bacterium]
MDVAILGAGFTGLWTALYLLRRDPSLRVAVLEREVAGFGASGRNGGWCIGLFPLSAERLRKRFGREQTRELLQAMIDTVDEVGGALEEEGIDCDFRKGGVLRVARGPDQLAALDAAYAEYDSLGLAERYRLLDPGELESYARVTRAVRGLFSPDSAVLHPGRLVRGLARAAERRGATIHEQTEVTGFVPGSSPRLLTSGGEVRARVLVLAGEAYLSGLPGLRRQLLPVYSQIALTEPLSRSQWEEIGWTGDHTISSMRLSVDYLARTADGRLLFGSRGSSYRYGSRISGAGDRDPAIDRKLRRMVAEWFPALREARFSHGWGGPIGVPRDWMPTVSYDPAAGVASARGYTGRGVATANLAGRILAAMITGADSPLRRLVVVGHRSPDWEPEPMRWLGVRFVQRELERIDRRAAATGRPPTGGSLAERLSGH